MHACVLASTAFAANIYLLKSNNIKGFLRILFEQLRYNAVQLVAALNIELQYTTAFNAFCPKSDKSLQQRAKAFTSCRHTWKRRSGLPGSALLGCRR